MRLTLDVVDNGESARGLVRMARCDMTGLGLRPGDTISVSGARRTHARVAPALIDPGRLQIDATVATNCGANAGDPVEVQQIALAPLSDVELEWYCANGLPPSFLVDAMYDMVLTQGDSVRIAVPQGLVSLKVTRTVPDSAGLVSSDSAIALRGAAASPLVYAGIAGLDRQIAQVHEMVGTPLSRPDLYQRLGIAPPRGVLFCGPPGSGKTLLARTVADRTKAAFFQIDGPEIVSKHYGDSEAALRRVFDAATRAAPAIVFIDEIDAIAPKRDGLSAEKQVERRLVAQLLTLMDGLSDRGRVIVMAATNLPDAIDPALRRPGRFDREIVFDPPNPEQRAAILALHLRDAACAPDIDLAEIARSAHGYVGADLAALAREAAVSALNRAVADAGGDEAAVDAADLFITKADLTHALTVTMPSALRGASGGHAPLDWDRIGGLDHVRAALRESLLWPLAHPEKVARFGLRPARGVILTGPPGSGKTMVARAVATEAQMNFIAVRPASLLSQYFGEAERAIAALFRTARQSAPSLLFFDELDVLAPERQGQDHALDRIVAQFLVELDGIGGDDGVIVLAATNRPGGIDPALMRPGRFDRVIELPYPDETARHDILSIHLRDRPLAPDLDLADLARRTAGCSGADLAALSDIASTYALRREMDGPAADARITQADLDAAFDDLSRQSAQRQKDHLVSPKGHSPCD